MTTPDTKRRHRRSRLFAAVFAVVALVIPLSITGSAAAHGSNGSGPKPTIVLVHGDWADGSSWSAVISRLQRQGYRVVAPPNPLRGPTEDAPYLASYLQTIPGPIVLVGHSYGGFVITNAATGNPNVKALVYIDAFVPDVNQTLAELSSPESCLDPATAFNAVPFSGGVDLKKISVPVLIMNGDGDQIVPYASSGPRAVELLQNGTLKTYPGFPHGMPTTHADTINNDLLAFIQS
jgi:pimeloyl-ACP methyl ester carboxylesterase